jgi:magnesium transporter
MVLGNSEIEGDGMFGSNPSLADMIKEQDNDNINQEEEIYFEAVTEHPDSLQLNDLGNTQAGNPDFVVDLDFKTYEWAEMEGRNWIDLPFELQSVDAILNSVCSILADNVLDLQLSANKMITELLDPGADVGDHAQEVLRTMKNSVKEMVSRVNGFCRAIDTTLDDFEDMALMNLTRLLTHPDRFIQPVPQSVLDEESDEPELILEAHLQRGHTLTNALSLVQGQIHSTEEFAVQKSDNVRNRLLYINMMISLLSLSVSGAGFVGSIFGMNVENPLEESSTAFFTLTFSTIGASLFFVIFVLFLIRRLGALPRVF